LEEEKGLLADESPQRGGIGKKLSVRWGKYLILRESL